MSLDVFHVFRNTPTGRETFMQAIDFCKKIGGQLYVYLPHHDRFMLYFDADAVEIHLDQSYLSGPETQKSNMEAVLEKLNFVAKHAYYHTKTGSTLPDIDSDFDVISLPKVMTEIKTGLRGSSIGPSVRRLVKASHAPALISPARFVDWNGIHVFFGGSHHAEKALRWALSLGAAAKMPVHVTTLLENKNEAYYRDKLAKSNIDADRLASWTFWREESLLAALYNVDRNQLIVMGAYGGSRIRMRLFGSTTEMILKNTANPLLLVGERCLEPKED